MKRVSGCVWHVCISAGIAAAMGCSDGSGSPDAQPDGPIDAAIVDADLTPDAFNPCPGQRTFTGDWVDWDSTPEMFKGIFDATLAEVGNPTNTAQTAPNGRGVLCIAPATDTAVDFTETDYLPMRFSVDGDLNAPPFNLHGITPARADTLFTGELSLTRDPDKAIVIVEVRHADGGFAAATVTTSATNDGAFVQNSSGVYVSGDTPTDSPYVLFANVDVSADVPITVTFTGGNCDGRTTLLAPVGSPAGVVATLILCTPKV